MKLHAAALLVWSIAAQACLLPEEIEAERQHPTKNTRYAQRTIPVRRQNVDNGFPIGVGDRFKAAANPPRGLGVDDRDLGSILNIDEVRTGLERLHTAFKDVKLFTAPHTTYENRSVYGAIIGEPRVFLQGGIHARERGGPDNVLYFISDLLHAREGNTGVTYGNKRYTHDQVVKALSAGIVFVPLVNPDGVVYDQQTNSCWRKNRNPESSTSEKDGVGIDLNRNFDGLWDYKRLFNPLADVGTLASDDPSSEIYHGTRPMSEPETQNVGWIMQEHKTLSWFLDLHSFGGNILYSWGDDNPQTTDPAQYFYNKAYDGKRGFLGDDPPESRYKEYIEAIDLQYQEAVSKKMATAMTDAGSVPYTARQNVELYPTSGGSNDYALSGYYGRGCGVNRIQGISIEFGNATGFACPFYPTNETYHESMRQVGAGLMEFLLYTAGAEGAVKKYKC